MTALDLLARRRTSRAPTPPHPPTPSCSTPRGQPFLKNVLLPHGMISDRVEKLAQDIIEDYPSSTPHLLVVLKGGSEFATDLSRCLRRIHLYTPNKHIPFTMDYVRVKSYAGKESTGTVSITGIEMASLAGRDVIVVEDIVDTGLTMQCLLPELKKHGPTSVRVSALLEKRTAKSSGFKADYVGFSVPDAFVVGYNLDYNEAFRDMPHICIINDAGVHEYSKGIVFGKA
jgi:hypoxanthine phosphoribosyltransferase